jgi:hypothetical protein
MAEEKSQEMPEPSERDRTEMSEAEIDRNLLETFPASDPPSWTLGTDHHTESTDPATEQPARDKDK